MRFVGDPARRVDGVTVSVDGTSVAHPAGELAGEFTWDPSGLAPGVYDLRVSVARPSWFSAVTHLTVVVTRDS